MIVYVAWNGKDERMNNKKRNEDEEDWAFCNWILKVDTTRNFITPYFCLFVHKLLDSAHTRLLKAHASSIFTHKFSYSFSALYFFSIVSLIIASLVWRFPRFFFFFLRMYFQ